MHRLERQLAASQTSTSQNQSFVPRLGRDTSYNVPFHRVPGMTEAFVWDACTPGKRLSSRSETFELLEEISLAFGSPDALSLTYAHHYRYGAQPQQQYT